MSAIVDILKQIAPNIKDSIYSYSSKEDFDCLWKLDERATAALADPDKKTTIVIVWDGIVERKRNDAVATGKYLTPIDWAVAFSLAVHDKIASAKKGAGRLEYYDLRILIFDLNSQPVSNADSVRLVNQSPDRSIMSMPWVRLFRPLDADKLIENLRNPVAVSSMKDTIEKSDMGLIRNIWAASLTRPSTAGDHHAIANLVGPLLLMKEDSDDSHVNALRSLMRALGLTPKSMEKEDDKQPVKEPKEDPLLSESNAWIKWDSAEWKQKLDKILKGSGNLNMLLIDDQYQQVWDKVLCRAVGATYKVESQKGRFVSLGSYKDSISVKATASPECLLARLDGEDHRFNFNICSDSTKDAEILFLDLRLFSGEAEDKKIKERDFFKRLSDVAKEYSKRENLPWPGFDNDEIARIRNWCDNNGDRDNPAYIEALTLLPRILALTDLSLPIIIFSTTGRRDITDKLKDYGNIITDFDKPKFTIDMPEDIAGQTKGKFVKAIGKALGCLAVRKGINELFKKCDAVTIPKKEIPANDMFATLYVDESGDGSSDRPMVLAGIMAAADDRKKLELFEKNLRENSPNWTINGGLSKYHNDIKDYEVGGKSIISRAAQYGVKLFGIVLSQSSWDGVTPPAMLLDDNVLDNLHRNMLRTLVEVVASYVVPNNVGDKVLYLSVIVDARSIPVDCIKEQESDIVNKLFDRFGMKALDLSLGGRLHESKRLIEKIESKLPSIFILRDGNYEPSKISELISNLITAYSSFNPKGQSFYVLDGKDVYPIVASVLEEYRYANLKIETEVVKALIVPDPQTDKSKKVSQLNFFADWLPRMVYKSSEDKSWLSIEWVKQLVSHGYIGVYDSSMEGLLRTRRLLMEGDDSAAIGSLLDMSVGNNLTVFPDTLNKLLLADISETLLNLSGEAFADSFEKMGRIESRNCRNAVRLYTVKGIDLYKGIVRLENSETMITYTADLKCWDNNLILKHFLPPLIGDVVSGNLRRGRTGNYRITDIRVTKAVNSNWRFEKSGLVGKIEKKLPNGGFLIKGDSALGKNVRIICSPQEGLAENDKVTFSLIRGYASSNLKSPWSLVAKNLMKAV